MRKPAIIANWKMNKTVNESVSYIKSLYKSVKKIKDVEIVISPSFVSIESVFNEARGTNIKLAAQNMFYEKQGAFTGEISPLMIKKYCDYVILGHSERRTYFNETNLIINKKIKIALEHNIKPILCIGETLKEKKQGKTKTVLKKQLSECLKDINKNQIKKIIIAYEPVWAIGTGNYCKSVDAEKIHLFIRNELKKRYKRLAGKIRIIYGGSAKPDNIKQFMAFDNIDGALVGGASLDAKSFSKIVKFNQH